jgi:hypothetical protein
MAVEVNVERKAVEVKWETGDYDGTVTVFAQGADGDWHNTSDMPNDGHCVLSYPADFEGESYVEVEGSDGVIDSGTIQVGDAPAGLGSPDDEE